jgi:chemotaxis family two-component system sensor kinase Cph1
MDQVIEFFKGLFDYSQWPPRWHCGNWSNFHGWLYIISDLMVWIAYFLIPLIIFNYFNKKRGTIKFSKVYLLFALFILLCGATHFLDAMMFWVPMYRLNALVRFATGVVSLVTVYYLFRLLPTISAQKTSVELEKEIELRKEAQRKLADANQGLEAFAFMASHDLQEPLRKVNMFINLLSKNNENIFDEKSIEYADKINKSTVRMQSLINDLLTLSTISENVQRSPANMNSAIKTALYDLEMKITQTNAQINVDTIPIIIGNENYLSQLFFNLIGNAIKFADKTPIINITAQQKDDKVIVDVTDNGIGIKEEFFDQIIQPFKRLHQKSDYEGTGIGLAICKKIMDIHNGQILIKSNPGQGTTFSLVFNSY